MSKSEEYRCFGQSGLEMASTAEDDNNRTVLIHMAEAKDEEAAPALDFRDRSH